MQYSRLSSVAVLAVVVALAGCDGAGKVVKPDVSPAAGIVTYNGAPVADAEVVLSSVQTKRSGWTCAGKTGADGKFTITSVFAPGADSAGIPPGEYVAVVLKTEAILAGAPKDMKSYDEIMKKKMADERAGNKAPETTGPKSLLPVKYSNDTSSDLIVKIEKAGNSNIELKLVD